MEMEYDYILHKISDATVSSDPFNYIEINNFLSDEHLFEILSCDQIHFRETLDNNDLHELLLENNYDVQKFPGCVDTWEQYAHDYLIRDTQDEIRESKGITFRLKKFKNKKIEKLINFMNSSKFQKVLEKKFNIDEDTNIVTAIQKNLSGYEISPHPDIRQKCLTYLLNINKSSDIERYDVHTHLLKFKDEYMKIEEFWSEKTQYNRCWVPWSFCNTIKKINKNNTLLIFKPCSKPASLHAVKLDYDHNKFQRTQIYGNLMYKDFEWCKMVNYDELEYSL